MNSAGKFHFEPGPLVLLPALVFLALLLRFWTIGSFPLHPDEIHYVFDYMVAKETCCLSAIRGLDCTMLVERRTAHPMLVPLLTRWLWFLPLGWLVDWTPGFLRGFNALVGALTVVPAWIAGHLLGGRKQGTLAALFVAIGPALVWTSRTAYLDPVYTFFICCWLASVAWGWKGGAIRAVILQGVFFGLLLSTKISGPLLLPPFLLGLLLAPPGTMGRLRIQHLLLGGGIGFLLWVLLCNPVAYVGAIFDPSDVRYADTWERERLGGVSNMIFVDLAYYTTTLVWDTPITAPLLAIAALYFSRASRNGYTIFLLFTLVCLAPLLFLHHPRLSGRHGFMPVHLVFALLASYGALLPRHLVLVGLGGTVLIAGASIVIHPFRDVPFAPRGFNALGKDPLHEMVAPYIHRRNPSHPILIIPSTEMIQPWIVTIRNAQLSEGAIVYLAGPNQRPVTSEAWEWNDIVVVSDSAMGDLEPVPPEFSAASKNAGEGEYTVYIRREGEARRSVPISDLPMDEDGRRRVILPGNIHPLSGRVLHEGNPLEHPSGHSPHFEGPYSVDDDSGGGVLEIRPPSREDVLWGF